MAEMLHVNVTSIYQASICAKCWKDISSAVNTSSDVVQWGCCHVARNSHQCPNV